MFTSVYLKLCRKFAADILYLVASILYLVTQCLRQTYLRRVCSKLAANLICMVKVCCMLVAYTQQYCCRSFTLLQRVPNLNINIQRFWIMSAAILLQCLLQTCGKCLQKANIFSKGTTQHYTCTWIDVERVLCDFYFAQQECHIKKVLKLYISH